MTKNEIIEAIKYILIMLLPVSLVYAFVDWLFTIFFPELNFSNIEEILSKSFTILVIIVLWGYLRKDKPELYPAEQLANSNSIIFNAVFFVFLCSLFLFIIKLIYTFAIGGNLESINNVKDIIVNTLFITVFVIINISKLFKYIRES